MSKPFIWQEPFLQNKDGTEYTLISDQHITVTELDGEEVIKIAPEALTLLARQAFYEASFFLRSAHLQQVASILNDPHASSNDKYVALQLLRNAEVSAKGVLPNCQDTGTATIVASKGQQIWTGGNDAEALSKGIYTTFQENNLRFSQNAPLDMFTEVNTQTNLPAQIDISAVAGDEYHFLCINKGAALPIKPRFIRKPNPYCNQKTDRIFNRKNEIAGHRCLPALPHRLCRRRAFSRSNLKSCQAGLNEILRQFAHQRKRARTSIP